MSTGALLTHGVSGYQCLGQPGDFQEQQRGEPWQSIVNDPITSYLNAQSHIGIPMSNFNEPWTGGDLQEGNWNSRPYRTPIFGESLATPPVPNMESITVATIDYPSHFGLTHDQQMPSARVHTDVAVTGIDPQNLQWESGTMNGDNKVFMPPGQIFVNPNTSFFQGGTTAAGTHPQNDIAGQQTTGNTTRPDFTGGQTPYQKLPNGQSVGQMQPGEAPQLWEMAPPPDPVTLPGEGTGMLAPTVPAWW